MKLLIDTNIILDLVLNRTNASICASLFRKISVTKDSAYITASSATDLFYIIRKETHNINVSYNIMGKILKMVSIITVTESDIYTALILKWNDFEDCVQYVAAKRNEIDYIITNNTKDFKNSEIPIVSPKDFYQAEGSQYRTKGTDKADSD